MKPIAILIHVDNVKQGVNWYAKAFPESMSHPIAEPGVAALEIGGIIVEIVKADDKVGAGKFGTVVYWEVRDLKRAICELEDIGARLYRGPMAIGNGLGMCQLEDPFGNLIGLRGDYK